MWGQFILPSSLKDVFTGYRIFFLQYIKDVSPGTSLVVQWLRLYTSTHRGTGYIPGQGTKVLHALPDCQKKTKKRSVKVRQTLFEAQAPLRMSCPNLAVYLIYPSHSVFIGNLSGSQVSESTDFRYFRKY